MKSDKADKGRYSKGKSSVENILQAATDLLIDQGYHKFSLRKVADAADVRLGNLQYYFPTKDQLVAALLDRTIQVYIDGFEQLRSQGTPEEQFRAIIKEVLSDLASRETTVFFPELWSLSNHEESVARAMEQMYSRYRQVLADVISEVNPTLTETQVTRLALFISCSMEGHTVFVGYQKPWASEIPNIIEMATQSFLWLIRSGQVPGQPQL